MMLKDMIKTGAAANILLVMLSLLAVFHLLTLLEVLPSNIVWGGRNESSDISFELLEGIGLAVTILFALVVIAKVNCPGSSRLIKAVNAGMWIVFGFFTLNTVTNILSASSLERLIFTPFSVVAALLSLRLAMERSKGMR